jgi:hypothetical protein
MLHFKIQADHFIFIIDKIDVARILCSENNSFFSEHVSVHERHPCEVSANRGSLWGNVSTADCCGEKCKCAHRTSYEVNEYRSGLWGNVSTAGCCGEKCKCAQHNSICGKLVQEWSVGKREYRTLLWGKV